MKHGLLKIASMFIMAMSVSLVSQKAGFALNKQYEVNVDYNTYFQELKNSTSKKNALEFLESMYKKEDLNLNDFLDGLKIYGDDVAQKLQKVLVSLKKMSKSKNERTYKYGYHLLTRVVKHHLNAVKSFIKYENESGFYNDDYFNDIEKLRNFKKADKFLKNMYKKKGLNLNDFLDELKVYGSDVEEKLKEILVNLKKIKKSKGSKKLKYKYDLAIKIVDHHLKAAQSLDAYESNCRFYDVDYHNVIKKLENEGSAFDFLKNIYEKEGLNLESLLEKDNYSDYDIYRMKKILNFLKNIDKSEDDLPVEYDYVTLSKLVRVHLKFADQLTKNYNKPHYDDDYFEYVEDFLSYNDDKVSRLSLCYSQAGLNLKDYIYEISNADDRYNYIVYKLNKVLDILEIQKQKEQTDNFNQIDQEYYRLAEKIVNSQIKFLVTWLENELPGDRPRVWYGIDYFDDIDKLYSENKFLVYFGNERAIDYLNNLYKSRHLQLDDFLDRPKKWSKEDARNLARVFRELKKQWSFQRSEDARFCYELFIRITQSHLRGVKACLKTDIVLEKGIFTDEDSKQLEQELWGDCKANSDLWYI